MTRMKRMKTSRDKAYGVRNILCGHLGLKRQARVGEWPSGMLVIVSRARPGLCEADWFQITALCGEKVRGKSRSWTGFSLPVLCWRCWLDICLAVTHKAVCAGNAAPWDTRPSLRWECALAIPGAAGFLPASGSVC